MGGYLEGTDEERRQVVKLLLEHGANPNVQNDLGITPLHIASDVETRDLEMVKLLLNHGADADIPDKNGTLPIDLVRGGGPTAKTIEHLLSSQSDDGTRM